MREIKFRIADKVKGEILEQGSSNLSMLYDCYDGDDDIVWLQYTGLVDGGGFEIYEGDLLRRQNGDLDLVIFDKGSFCVRHKNGDVDLIAYHNHFEVVCSVYENKELLERQ